MKSMTGRIVIKLLLKAISHGIQSFMVHLDSQLVVTQLNGVYCVSDPTLMGENQWVQLLEHSFESIRFAFFSFIIKHK